ncbi:hypothetical protein ABLG96_08140 [Nakamurella sp. A5-74]|uniref:DUF1254 domain-containing protein n=1 Tax=Nakamurella sp. A5-74 TaxID=3158264 RepID=A0AAU8DTS0_9ACTN
MTRSHTERTLTIVPSTTAWNFSVYLEYGQVYLMPAWGDSDSPGEEMDDMVDLLGHAFDPGIASGKDSTVFVLPHRDAFGVPLQAQLWDSEPPKDLGGWDEAFEASLIAGERGVTWVSPTVEGVDIPVPAGRYRARISGRGLLRPPWDEELDEKAFSDQYRIQLWPTTDMAPPERLLRWPHPETCSCI